MTRRYFEDISAGESHEFGPREVTKSEILDFANQYDPQQFHVDEQAAQDSYFGEVIASGWHTASVCMRLLVDGLLTDLAVVGALGIDELRWRNPVRPGDEITISVEIATKETWNETNGRVEFLVEGYNQHGDEVMRRRDLVLIERKEPES